MDNTLTNERTHTSSKTRILAQIGMLGAISVVLMLFEIPLPFAPAFYEIDFSEVPVLVGCFAMGPVAGAAIELIKILLNFAINGTITAGVGELANFLLGCSFVVPAGIIYRKMHTRKGAIIGMATGTVLMTILWMFPECICIASGLRQSFRYANGSTCRNGNCSQCSYYQPVYLCGICSRTI